MTNQLQLSSEQMNLQESSQKKSWAIQVYESNLDKKISDYTTTSEYIELNNLIAFWRNNLGIKDAMTPEELEMCLLHIKDLYGDFSVTMIRLAIKASLKGELKCDIKPYGAFSPMYISMILNAYKSYNDRIVSEQIRQQRKQSEPAEKIYTDQEKLANRLFYLNDYKSKVSEGYLLDFKGIMWDFLTNNNVLVGIEADKEFIKKEKMKMQNQFLDFGIEDEEKASKYSIIRQFFQLNPDFDFTKYKVL